MNTLTENYWLIYAAATVIWPYHVGYYFQSLRTCKSKTSTLIPCPVDRDDIVTLRKGWAASGNVYTVPDYKNDCIIIPKLTWCELVKAPLLKNDSVWSEYMHIYKQKQQFSPCVSCKNCECFFTTLLVMSWNFNRLVVGCWLLVVVCCLLVVNIMTHAKKLSIPKEAVLPTYPMLYRLFKLFLFCEKCTCPTNVQSSIMYM